MKMLINTLQQQIHELEAAIIRDSETIAQIDDRVKMAGYQQQIYSLSSQIRALADVVKRLQEKVGNLRTQN